MRWPLKFSIEIRELNYKNEAPGFSSGLKHSYGICVQIDSQQEF
jgi:hypothetical protein